MMTKELVPLDPVAVAKLLGIPPVQVSVADMAWMAGIIDAKGAVVRKNNKTRRTPQVVLYVQAKDARIARFLSELTGTAPEPREARGPDTFVRRGCAEHCLVPHVHVGDAEYPWQMPETTRWSLTGIAAAVVLVNLAPFMCTYADYAADVAEVLGSFAADGRGSGAVRRTVLRLSELGWQIPAVVTARLAERSEGA